jgi:hypothetical protein
MRLDELRIALKRKYRLVHVPSRHKATAWADAVREFGADGSPPEEAGHRAALKLFPYEYRPSGTEGPPRVRELLEDWQE